jgi:hypothetical protein
MIQRPSSVIERVKGDYLQHNIQCGMAPSHAADNAEFFPDITGTGE